MTNQEALHAWRSDTAVLAARFPHKKVRHALEQVRALEPTELSSEEGAALARRLAAEHEVASSVAWGWKAFLAKRLEQQPHHGLSAEEVLKQLVRHDYQDRVSHSMADYVGRLEDVLNWDPSSTSLEVMRSHHLPSVLWMLKDLVTVAMVSGMVKEQLEKMPLIESQDWASSIDSAAPEDVVEGMKSWLAQFKSQVVIPSLLLVLNEKQALGGFATYDFPLFLIDAVPGGDLRLMEWADEAGLSLFHQVNEAAAKPEPVVASVPRAFRPR